MRRKGYYVNSVERCVIAAMHLKSVDFEAPWDSVEYETPHGTYRDPEEEIEAAIEQGDRGNGLAIYRAMFALDDERRVHPHLRDFLIHHGVWPSHAGSFWRR